MSGKNLICVIAVYNEEEFIEDTINSIKKIKEIDNIVIVNDGSTDNTLNVIKSLDIDFISYEKNMGKGYALKRAITELNYDYMIMLDGDLGKTSSEVSKIIKPVLLNKCDFTIAKFPEARTMTNKKGGLGLVKGLAKNGIKFFTGKDVSSSLSGQRVYKKEVLDNIEYIPNNYGVEVAMTVQALNSGFTLKEVPVIMGHRYTSRDLSGFIHRGKQFKDILFTFIIMFFKGLKR